MIYKQIKRFIGVCALSLSLWASQICSQTASETKKPKNLDELLEINKPSKDAYEISPELVKLKDQIENYFSVIQGYEKVKDKITQYKKDFDSIKEKTNPPPSHNSSRMDNRNLIVEDDIISKEINDLLLRLEKEQYADVYAPLKEDIRNFEYLNIKMSVSFDGMQFMGGGRSITGINIQKYYNKRIDEIYFFNPSTGNKRNLPVPDSVKGKDATQFLYIKDCNTLQDWYRIRKETGYF